MMLPRHVEANDDSAKTVRQGAWEALQALAELERRRVPHLTEQAAVALAMTTERGRELYALYTGRDASLTQAEAAEKRRMRDLCERATGHARWGDAVAAIAKGFSEARGTDYSVELDSIAKRYPQLWRAYLDERRA